MKHLLCFFAGVVLIGAQSLQAQWKQTNLETAAAVWSLVVNGSNLVGGHVHSPLKLN
jgi:hypothetical protein